jgi:hypothetical protein
MKKILTILICLYCFTQQTTAQSQYFLFQDELSPMPEKVSNNAVTKAFVNEQQFAYSFSGIDSTKSYSGIHLRSFRYDVSNDAWETIAPLPDTLGKIAAGASTVKNKIYIIGGYHVYVNGNEKSSDKVHIYDPETNSYLADGSPIPVPIDDQVQGVWRDSLIYVMTGWSDNTNVANVQIYNPSNDTWQVGTPLPNSTNSKLFGASGVIIGDTIYFAGGARYANNFPATNYFHKGVIDPNNPTNITWISQIEPTAKGYRMAAFVIDFRAYWYGGSKTTYNYDGIAYNGTGGVSPTTEVKIYNPADGILSIESIGTNHVAVMDFRGSANVGDNSSIICGGMLENQEVTNSVFYLSYFTINTNPQNIENKIQLFPNPTVHSFQLKNIPKATVYLFNISGQLVLKTNYFEKDKIDVSQLPKGVYNVVVKTDTEILSGQLLKE